MISKAVIEDIKYRNDIESVISSYVTLKRAGSNLLGLCPFHSERTPSFTVFTGNGTFYCFGCGVGGDVITFIMKAENLDYPAALEFLAKRAGIVLTNDAADDGTAHSRQRILAMNRDAAKFFHESLKSDKTAWEYLTVNRKISPAAIRHFGLGYAPPDFGALTRHMQGLGYTADELACGFLCGISKKTGRPYDYFRGRIIFPIIDTSGNVIAFGGRITDNSQPKYLNTSDTPAFKKSRNLFALNFAKSHCSESIILCEGYMDVIALHSAGFENAVATLGTAITSEQAMILKKYTKTVFIAYDSDAAGQKAADKAFRLLYEVALDAKVIDMAGAKDPDEYIGKFGSEAFAKLLDGGRSRFDFKLDGILKDADLNNTDDKLKAAAAICSVIAEVSSEVERDVYISRAAERLGISAESLAGDVRRQRKRLFSKKTKDEIKKIVYNSEGYGDRVNPDYIKNVKAAAAEEVILGIMMLYPDYIGKIRKSEIQLGTDDFSTSFGKRVFEAILRVTEDGTKFDLGLIGQDFNESEMGRITKLQLKRAQLTDNNDTVLASCVAELKSERAKQAFDIGDMILLKRERQKSNE